MASDCCEKAQIFSITPQSTLIGEVVQVVSVLLDQGDLEPNLRTLCLLRDF